MLLLAAASLAALAIGLRTYGRLLRHALAGRGHVWTGAYGIADLLVCSVLFTWLGGAAYQGFTRSEAPRTLTNGTILESALLFGAVVGAIFFLLHARGHSVARTFGLRQFAPRGAYAEGLLLFLVALPLVFACFVIVSAVAGEEARPQEITQFFIDAAGESNWPRVILATLLAVFVAPITEEFIFRGYFYGVLRRFTGVLPALLFTSFLFASIHLNTAVLLPLFVLAACLTLAYEATGSLLTCITMHSLFNATMLAMMFYIARHP